MYKNIFPEPIIMPKILNKLGMFLWNPIRQFAPDPLNTLSFAQEGASNAITAKCLQPPCMSPILKSFARLQEPAHHHFMVAFEQNPAPRTRAEQEFDDTGRIHAAINVVAEKHFF